MKLSLLFAFSLCPLFSGCMTSLATMNRAEGKYTWPSRHERPALEPHSAYYALLPVTVPFDIATLPIQIPIFIVTFTLPEPEKTDTIPNR